VSRALSVGKEAIFNNVIHSRQNVLNSYHATSVYLLMETGGVIHVRIVLLFLYLSIGVVLGM